MDRPLESSRDQPYGGGDRAQYRGGGQYGAGNQQRGRGKGRARGGGGGGSFRGRGWGRGGGGGRPHHNNRRFPGQRNNYNDNYNSNYEDPNARLIKQLSVMISRVGEFKVPEEKVDSELAIPGAEGLRPVVLACAKNITELTKVVCKASNVATFLKFIPPPPPPRVSEDNTNTGFGFQRPPPKPEDQAGPMAHLIVSCAATLPLQTACYAALTLSAHAHSDHHADYAGFAHRCVLYALQRLSYDMDTLFCATAAGTADQRAKIACRIKLLLRYLALLGRLKVIQAQDDENADGTAAGEGTCSLLGFLQRLVEAAIAAAPTDDAFGTTSSSNAAASLVLVYFVLSTIPYLLSYIPPDVIQELLLDPLQTLLGNYSSSFTPGVGMTAILLKEEQLERGDDDEEEEEEEDEDEEEEASEVICDSLQDLHRSVQQLIKEHSDDKPVASRFALLTDEPWKSISAPEEPPPPPPPFDDSAMNTDTAVKAEEGVAIKQEPDIAEAATQSAATPLGPVVYPGTPMRLKMPEGGFQSLNLLINFHNNDPAEEEATSATPEPRLKIQAFPLEVVVFGRLPFFGGPQPAAGDAKEEGDMEDEDTPANDEIGAYTKEFGVLDRCFMADAIRDLLCCHESTVSATGLEWGSAKGVAEQLWSIGHVFATAGDKPNAPSGHPIGMEYGILEVLISLILQSSSNTNSTFRQIFLSRVLLELTRLQPARVSPALALGVSNLFQDYCPALVPPARRNLSCWLAFHLINTDYQWPAAYWMHWQTYTANSSKIFSRGFVVKNTLQFLAENVNNPKNVIKDCLPGECTALAKLVVAPIAADEPVEEVIDSIEKEIRRRMWDEDEHPATLMGYIIGEDFSQTLESLPLDGQSSLKRIWCRIGVIFRSLLQPVGREHERLLSLVEEALKKAEENVGSSEDDNAMDEDDELTVDTLAVLQEALIRYESALIAVMKKDKEVLAQLLQGSDNDNLLSTCEPYLVSILFKKAGFSRFVMEGALDCLLQQGIVNSSSILRWALDDIPSGGEQPKMIERWWEFATDAMRAELAKQKTEARSKPIEEGGMVIDRTGEDAASQSNSRAVETLNVMESLSPLLDYIVRRACAILAEQVDDQQQGNKLKPHQVDLVEGVKYCVRAAYGLFFSELRNSNENEYGVTEREIQDALSQSTMTGWKLAGICQEFSGGHAVNVLRESLLTV